MTNQTSNKAPNYDCINSPNEWMVWPVIILLAVLAILITVPFGAWLFDLVVSYWSAIL